MNQSTDEQVIIKDVEMEMVETPLHENSYQPKTPTPAVVLPDVVSHLSNLDGFIQTLEFVPTYKPARFIDQFVLVTSGGSTRAYWYDTKPSGTPAWRYVVLTT